MGDNFTLFKNDSSGATPNDFEKDAFQDITLPATSNAGFSSTSLTNPSNAFVVNSDVPRYGVKTLWIKKFEPIEDRSRWIEGKETYKIIWAEDFAPVEGYMWGVNPNNVGSILVAGLSPFSGMAVTGVIRKAKAIIGVGQEDGSGGTEVQTLDTVTTTTTSLSALALTSMARFSEDSVASNQTKNIHTFGVRSSSGSIQVVGFEVYFENSTQDIDIFPGTSYVNKTKVETVGVTNMPLPSHGSSLGGNMLIYKTSGGGYSSILTTATMVQSIGQGLSGTNVVNVTTGEGTRFAVGDAITISGTTAYIGRISSISTDALTVSPTLPFGYSNLLYRLWQNGCTASINTTLMEITDVIDFANMNFKSSTISLTGGSFCTYYLHPQDRYAFFGNRAGWLDIGTTTSSAFFGGLAFSGASAFLQIEGFFSAAEFVFSNPNIAFVGNVYTNFANGITAFVGVTMDAGINKHTALNNAGVGWNSVRINCESSTMSMVYLQKVNLFNYRKNVGVTHGNLSQMRSIQAQINRTHNASLISFGMHRRIFADHIPFFSAVNWTRSSSHIYAGGIQYVASNAGASFIFHWYGKDFAIVGTQGSSYVFTIDGGATSVSFNVLNSVPTLGHHKITYTHHAGTVSIQAIDYRRDFGEMLNLQKSTAVKTTPKTGVYRVYKAGTLAVSDNFTHVVHADIRVKSVKAKHVVQGSSGITAIYLRAYDAGFSFSYKEILIDPIDFGIVNSVLKQGQYAVQGTLHHNQFYLKKGTLIEFSVATSQTAHDGTEIFIEYEEL